MMKEIDKIDGAEALLQDTVHGIEAAQADVQVFEALKQGDQVLKDLKSRVSIEDFEALYDDHQDMLKQQDREREMFGELLNDDEIEADLERLMAEDIIENGSLDVVIP